jgi:hypothetical protein
MHEAEFNILRILCIKRRLRAKIMTNRKIIEQVNSFSYLGCNLSHISLKDFDNKLIKFQQLIGTTKKTVLKRVRILKFYKTLVIPTLLHGSETWTLTAFQLKRLEAAERPLLDHKRNEDIRKKLKKENITSIIST